MPQTISPLEPADLADLDAKREWVAGHLGEGAEPGFEHPGTKLNIIQAVLDNGWVTAKEAAKLQALGVVLGDVLVDLVEAKWVIVDDEFGRDAALLVSESPNLVVLFPLTMIAKRVERGDAVDVSELLSVAAKSAIDKRSR